MIKDFLVFILKPLSFLPAIVMMCIIFSFSAQDGVDSGSLSHEVSVKIVEVGNEVLQKGLSDWEIDEVATKIEYPVRKVAHMTEYFLLAVAVSFPFYVYGLRGFPLMLVAGAICVGFACGDEYHQSFVDGRGPSARDVGIDSIGVFAGIITVRIFCWIVLAPSRMLGKLKFRKQEKEEYWGGRRGQGRGRSDQRGRDSYRNRDRYDDYDDGSYYDGYDDEYYDDRDRRYGRRNRYRDDYDDYDRYDYDDEYEDDYQDDYRSRRDRSRRRYDDYDDDYQEDYDDGYGDDYGADYEDGYEDDYDDYDDDYENGYYDDYEDEYDDYEDDRYDRYRERRGDRRHSRKRRY